MLLSIGDVHIPLAASQSYSEISDPSSGGIAGLRRRSVTPSSLAPPLSPEPSVGY